MQNTDRCSPELLESCKSLLELGKARIFEIDVAWHQMKGIVHLVCRRTNGPKLCEALYFESRSGELHQVRNVLREAIASLLHGRVRKEAIKVQDTWLQAIRHFPCAISVPWPVLDPEGLATTGLLVNGFAAAYFPA